MSSLKTRGDSSIIRSKCLTLVVIIIILCPIILTQVHTANARLREPISFPIFKKNPLGLIASSIFPIINFAEGYKAIPSNITLGINEKVTFQVGMYNLSSGEFEVQGYPFFLTQRYATFEAVFPNGNPGNVWFVVFDPPIVQATKADHNKLLLTNVTVSLTSPPQATDFMQTQLLQIKVTDSWVAGNLWFAKKSDMPNSKLFFRLTWPLAALTGGFGKWSGTVLDTEYIVNVVVYIKAFHAVKIQALPPSKLAPNEITSIPVMVENQGNYNDTFNFKIRTETGYPLTLTNNATITLQPGEQGQAFVGVAVPANVLDTGTLHSIFIDTYSADNLTTSIATQRIFVETQGLYFSEESSVYTLGVGLLFLIGVVLFLTWRRKISETIRKKPQKPWKIPEERQHLTELKRTDKNAFEQERVLMEDEYNSALLWYKDDRKQLRTKPTKEKSIKTESSFFKKLVAPFKTEVKTKQKQKEKQKKKPLALLKKPKEKTIKPLAPIEDTTKEKILAKIRREQEKQLRKLQ
jgi:hypothetical protein